VRPSQRAAVSPSIALGLLLLGGCPVYQTSDADRFPCTSNSDCYSKQATCQPAFNPDGTAGTFCSACNPGIPINEYATCSSDTGCACPLQCLRAAAPDAGDESRCFYPCANTSNCPHPLQVCDLKNDGICIIP
jgi:hypothetical protein